MFGRVGVVETVLGLLVVGGAAGVLGPVPFGLMAAFFAGVRAAHPAG